VHCGVTSLLISFHLAFIDSILPRLYLRYYLGGLAKYMFKREFLSAMFLEDEHISLSMYCTAVLLLTRFVPPF
jgi:hypothetical protein